jgi:hypothetical protein
MSEERKTVTKAVAVEETAKPTKRERNSITGTRTKLSLTGEEPGFHYAWINDENVGTAEDAGYEYVSHAIKVGNRHVNVSEMSGSKISRNVGGGTIAYLMRVPQEWYDEDMEAEQRSKVDASEERIFIENNSNGLNGGISVGWDKPNPKLNLK